MRSARQEQGQALRGVSSGDLTYIKVTRVSSLAGTIGFDPSDRGVSRFIARSDGGRALAVIIDTNTAGFRVEAGGASNVYPHWQAAAEAVFGPGISLAHA
jgi:hypothetical protein